VRLWPSFLGYGQLSVRSRSCEPCYWYLLVSKTLGAVGVQFRWHCHLSRSMGSFTNVDGVGAGRSRARLSHTTARRASHAASPSSTSSTGTKTLTYVKPSPTCCVRPALGCGGGAQPLPMYSDGKVANRNFRVGDRSRAVSRRPPISLDTIAARTHMYTYAAEVWALSLVQGSIFCRPAPNPNRPIRHFCIAAWGVFGL
jgi:hypothetical protein